MSSNDYSAQVFGPRRPSLTYRYSHGDLGDEKEVALTLYKQSDFELFRQGTILTPSQKILALRDAPSGFLFALQSKPDEPHLLPYAPKEWTEWAMTPLPERRIPFLVFDLDDWVAEVTHLHARGNFWQYARLTAPDRRQWLGVSGYLQDSYIDPELPPAAARELHEIFGVKPGTLTRVW